MNNDNGNVFNEDENIGHEFVDTGKGILYKSLLKNEINITLDEFNKLWSYFENECRNLCDVNYGYPAVVFCNGLGGAIMPIILEEDIEDFEDFEDFDEDEQ